MREDGMYNPFVENNSYGDPNQGPPLYSSKTCDLYGTARAAFIQKVYTVLTIQILCTVFFILLSMFSESFFAFQVNNMWMLYLTLIVGFFIQIYLFCCKGGRDPPENYICCAIFTFCQAYLVSFISSATGHQSGNGVVLLAGIYTLAIVAALTVYACNTESDFTTSTGILIVLAVCLMTLGLVTIFVHSNFLDNLYCCLGVFVFGIYLIVDTQLIMGGKQVELAIDEYILAAMMLYIDIIQIFLYILRLLGDRR